MRRVVLSPGLRRVLFGADRGVLRVFGESMVGNSARATSDTQ
jgi:hypothetical protein